MDNRRAGHMQVEVDIQLREELADQSVTSADQGVLPLPVVAQTFHLFCPFQSCVVSAYMHKPCNKPYLPYKTATVKPLEFRHFQQSLQQWKICMLLVVGRT